MAASLKVPKQIRSWKTCDSYDNSDVVALFDAEKVKVTKPANCARYWSLYLSLIGVFSLFFIAILVGFYLRDDRNVTKFCSGEGKRGDGLGDERLQAVHNNVVYHVSGDRIIQYVRELKSLKNSTSFLEWDSATAGIVEREFRNFGFDHVDIEEKQLQFTSPESEYPNSLQVVLPDGSTSLNVSIVRGDNSTYSLPPFVAFSPSADVQGQLVYGGAGRYVDFVILQVQGVILHGAVVLLHLDDTPVSEKVQLAEQFSCAGVLLFCPHDNVTCFHDNKDAPFASVADFLDSAYTPKLPVQTISTETGSQLLQMSNILGTNNLTSHRAPAGTNLTVKLSVNNSRQHSLTVYSVIGTILGDLEPDRQVLTGTGRQAWPDSDVDAVSSTAMLLEMARSFLHNQRLAGWRPRRTVKFVSWGGHHLSQAGLLHHYNTQRDTLAKEAVTYVEMNSGKRGSDVIKMEASPALTALAKIAKAMVPNPANPDISLDIFSPDMSNQAVYQSERGLTMAYTDSSVRYPMMLHLGIPMVTVGVKQNNKSQKANDDYKRDITHHYKYHVSQCRVVSRVLLSLIDSPILSLDVNQYSEHLKQMVNQSVAFLHTQGSQCKSIGTLESLLKQLASSNSQSSVTSKTVKSCEKLREINNHLMRLDQVFVTRLTNQTQLHVGSITNHSAAYIFSNTTHSNGLLTNQKESNINSATNKNVWTYILAEDQQKGVLQLVSDAWDVYSVTQNKSVLCETISNLSTILNGQAHQLKKR